MPSFQQPFMPAGPVSQQDLDDAGIPAIVIMSTTGAQIQMKPGSVADDFTDAKNLVATKLGQPIAPSVSLEKAQLTDAWLAIKACLDALPSVPEEGDDPYADTRLRLTDQVQIAENAMNNAGGPG